MPQSMYSDEATYATADISNKPSSRYRRLKHSSKLSQNLKLLIPLTEAEAYHGGIAGTLGTRTKALARTQHLLLNSFQLECPLSPYTIDTPNPLSSRQSLESYNNTQQTYMYNVIQPPTQTHLQPFTTADIPSPPSPPKKNFN